MLDDLKFEICDFMPIRTRIKICGLRTLDAALCAADSGADAVGFVFVERSPRFVSAAQCRAIVSKLPAFVEPVALFADAPADQILSICDAMGIRTVQLHGRETIADVEALSDLRVIKAINFGDDSQASWLASASPANVVGLLIDAPATPQAAGLTGGSGHTFDWAALASLDRAALPPIILAGGLTPENVASAIAAAHPFAVDVSSGVEASRGNKDLAKIRAFCAAVQRADVSRL